MLQVELTPEKIASFRREIEKNNSMFKDERYLDSLFLPSEIMGRSKQARQLIQYVSSLKRGLLVPVISVYGRSGSGKSTVVRYVLDNLPDISFSFVNLRKAKTVFGCANLILSALGESNLKKSQGMNKAIELIEQRIEEILIQEKKKFFVLALDEYDVIFSDPRGRPSDFVYTLLNMVENLREKEYWLCIVTISNNALAEHELDDRVKSRMGNSEVFFEPYVGKDILDILQDRAKKAFVKKIDDKVLNYCAQLSSDDHGDARRSLDLLRIAADLSDGKKIMIADVDSAVEFIQKDRVSTILSNASSHQHFVVLAICACTIEQNAWNATSSIYERYCKIISQGKKQLSYRRIVDLLVELKDSGLVISQTASKGRHGYGTDYKLKFSPYMIGPLISERIWNNIIQMKKSQDKIDAINKIIKKRNRSRSISPMRALLLKNME